MIKYKDALKMVNQNQEDQQWTILQNPQQMSLRHENESLQHTEVLTEANVKALDDQYSVLNEEVVTQAQTKTIKTNAISNVNTLS